MCWAKFSHRGNKDMVVKQKLLISLSLTRTDVLAYFIFHVRKDIYGKFITEHRWFNAVGPCM